MAPRTDDDSFHVYMYQSDSQFEAPPRLLVQDRTADPVPDTVIPHRLCDECRRFCASFALLVTPHRIQHYAASTNIAIAARSGCHLCSINLARLRYLPPVRPASRQPDRKWTEDYAGPLDSVVNRPRAKYKGLRSGYLVVDFYYPSDRAALERLNYGSVYLLPSEGTSPFQGDAHLSRWSTSLRSLACFDLARRWLNRCCSKHLDCRSVQHSAPPKRLISIGSVLHEGRSENHVRITSSHYGPTPEYVTFSWRWPAHQPIRLLKSNIETFSTRIHQSALPQLFRDAIEATRKLGYAYLWIDALCIVQDDDASKSDDIAHMDEVFGASSLSIAAASAPGIDQGFLGARWPLSSHDCWLSREGNANIVAEADIAINANSAPGFCPLDRRGWVIQERLLSPRTLYFSDRHIFWECRMKNYHEQRPFSEIADFAYRKRHQESDSTENEYGVDAETGRSLKRCYTGMQTLDTLDKGGIHWEHNFRSMWQQVLSQYTWSGLTLEEDKLRALAGTAALIRRHFQSKNSFGLWHDFFVTELLWRVITLDSPHPNLQMENRVPSWSWMYCNRPVTNSWTSGLRSQLDFPEYDTRSITATITQLPRETSFHSTLHPINDFEPFKVGIKGPLTRVEYGRDETERPDEYRTDTGYFITTAAKRQAEQVSDLLHLNRNFYADYVLEEDLELWCLLITRTIHDVEHVQGQQLGLVLTPIAGFSNRFRRVGAMVLKPHSTCAACQIFSDDAPIVDIELV